jgi:DNA-binding MarR family transcriptional regulator
VPRRAAASDSEVLIAIAQGLLRAGERVNADTALFSNPPPQLAAAKQRLDAQYGTDHARRIADYDLFYRMGGILSGSSQPLTMGELSRALSVPMSTATRIVDSQVRDGYVERLSDPNDRRRVRVAMTLEGRELYRCVEEFLVGRLARLLRGFSQEERRQFADLLGRVVTAAEEIGA